MGFIEFIGVSKSFGDRKVISDLHLKIKKNKFLGILGSSGCGKTTLLRLLAGFEMPDSGRIIMNGNNVYDSENNEFIPPEKRDVGMVFQDLALWPHITVSGHIDFVLKAKKIPKEDRREKIKDILELLGLKQNSGSYPRQLSGGEKQKVAIARAIAQEPSVLLMDEPMSNLDQILKNSFKKEITRLQKRLGITTLYVTHNYMELLDMADEIAIMRGGRIIRSGETRDVYKKPGSEFVAEILGKSHSPITLLKNK